MFGQPRSEFQRRLEEIVDRVADAAESDLLQCPLAEVEDTVERLWQLRIFCTPLLVGVDHPTAHFNILDEQLSTLLQRSTGLSHTFSCKEAHTTQASSTRAESLLSRLPELPQRSFSLPFNNGLLRQPGTTVWDGIKDGRWAAKYVVPESRSHLQMQASEDPEATLQLLTNLQDIAWQSIYVTKHIDSNSLILAVVFANQATRPNFHLARRSFDYVNVLSELLDEYESMCDAASFGIQAPFEDPTEDGHALKEALFPEEGEDHEQARAIIKVFLWSAWQRSVMLHLYYVIGVQLAHGYSSTWNSLLAVRGIHELMFLSNEDYRGNCTEYLCNWAFELLRTSRTSVGLDFRRTISRFDYHFHEWPGRCIKGSTHTCQGGHPESCQRFTGAETATQSAHDSSCDRQCSRITWCATSYLNSPKPAAVVADEELVDLTYLPVTSRTLAISHVWSHGQGGRPESGINSCLHRRYCRLVRRFECDTYWIDAVGIPTETTLRRQAINHINVIFATAKVTLVMDADIQSIDISLPDPTIAEIETLVCTLLVCDWNVRGWTALEAIRGSRAIFLLCKGDRTINLRKILTHLHEHGAVDIGVLLGSTQHLIPHSDPTSTKTVEEAGYILSQRHTSWPEDVITCWTLLMNAPVQNKAIDLWKNQTQVRTGYLLSSAPRVREVEGFGWAPESPYVRPIKRSVYLDHDRKQEYSVRIPPYDGDGSLYACVTARGLQGKWRVVNFDRSLLEAAEELCCEKVPPPEAYQGTEIDVEPDSMIFAHPDEALAWFVVDSLLTQGADVRLVRALATDGVSACVGTSQRGEDFGLVAAICASFDKGVTWQWKGVFSWQESENYAGWEVAEMLIV